MFGNKNDDKKKDKDKPDVSDDEDEDFEEEKPDLEQSKPDVLILHPAPKDLVERVMQIRKRKGA